MKNVFLVVIQMSKCFTDVSDRLRQEEISEHVNRNVANILVMLIEYGDENWIFGKKSNGTKQVQK